MGSLGAGARVGVPPGHREALEQREREENFPVALRILPRRVRADLHAVYAFARTVDEIGDAWPGDRTERLHQVEADLDRLATGAVPHEPAVAGLVPVLAAHDLDPEPFRRLVRANLRDQVVTCYATFADLLDYCRLSADPVGEIVLGVFDRAEPGTVALSNRVCTALQLLEHWQDVAEDRRNGRIYLPREDLDRYGVADDELDRPVASRPLRRLIDFEVARAADQLESGAPIVAELHGWARLCVAGFVAGGRATVTALRDTDGDVLSRTARPSRLGTATQLLRLLAAARTPRGPR